VLSSEVGLLLRLSGVQPLAETIPNFAIDVGVVAGAVFLYQREIKAGERRLERLARGAMVGSLSVELSNGKVVKVSDLRGSRRVLIVGGNSEKVKEILKSGKAFQKRLEERNLVVVPVAFDKIADFKEISGGWTGQSVAEAVLTNEWKLWAEEESKRVRAPDVSSATWTPLCYANSSTKPNGRPLFIPRRFRTTFS